MSEIFHQLVDVVVTLVGELGYVGIFILMTLESSFIPFPSEVVLIPAGYYVSLGEMNAMIVVLAGVAGSLLGALINYYLSMRFGRQFILKYGRFVFLSEDKFNKLESAFLRHGSFATFVGRLIFGIRQWISIPAGLSKMSLGRFCTLTSLGAGIWVVILVMLGYVLGESQKANEYAKLIGLWMLGVVIVMSFAYAYWFAPKRNHSA